MPKAYHSALDEYHIALAIYHFIAPLRGAVGGGYRLRARKRTRLASVANAPFNAPLRGFAVISQRKAVSGMLQSVASF